MQLQFSKYNFQIKTEPGRQLIFDIVRKKYVTLTPEEWVRQYILHYLIYDHKYPKSLISVEKKVAVNGLPKRTDIVLYNREAQPKIIVECKSPDVALSQKTFEQVARYNLTLQVPMLWVTNGAMHYLCRLSFTGEEHTFLQKLPTAEEIMAL